MKADRTCVVQLGRYGDIINILPLCYALHQKEQQKPILMVSREHCSIADGVSYVDPVIYEDKFVTLKPALARANSDYQRVLRTQLYARDLTHPPPTQSSFVKESWLLAGWLAEWGRWPLVFDKRNLARETDLVSKLWRKTKPLLLVNLAGKSSPYPWAGRLFMDICHRWNEHFEIVNLAAVKATALYDLLGLMDVASGVITTDTSTAHLIRASSTPYILLATDRPLLWNGTPAYENCALRLCFGESRSRREMLHDVIAQWANAKSGYSPKFLHVYSEFTSNPDAMRRHGFAKATWHRVYVSGKWRTLAVSDAELTRMFQEGESKLPYIKDLLDFAANRGSDDQMIVLTNTDTCFAPSIESQLEGSRCSWAARRDFKSLTVPLSDVQIKSGVNYPGTDLFAMTVQWWKQNRDKFPDMLIGREGWDCCLREMMRKDGGRYIGDIIYHERHDSTWEKASNRFTLEGQKYNRTLANDFLKRLGLNPRTFNL